ncbi:MAG: MOSC domain-containing protein [Pseudomonadota bacterium]
MTAAARPTLHELQGTLPFTGTVTWIGVRPARGAALDTVDKVLADPKVGLVGDRYAGRSGKRQVTLIDAAHLAAVAACLDREAVAPDLVRRNIVVSGFNLLALKGRRFQVGDALMEWTAPCHPCSRMETVLGPGGYNAMRGHGGICARVLSGGLIRRGDPLTYRPD